MSSDPPPAGRDSDSDSDSDSEPNSADDVPASRKDKAIRDHAAMRDGARTAIDHLQQELNRLQRSIRLTIQAKLAQLAGQSFGSLDQNRQVTKALHELLDGHGLRVRCSECGRPSILRVSPRRGASAGVFVFDHTVDRRRTFHGGRSTMPQLHLVAKPARQASSAARRAAG